MEQKLILELNNHKVYYIKNNEINYYITIPNSNINTNICIELKSKMNNYNLELNDEVWVMENIKNTFSYIDDYNITLVIPVLKEEDSSILEKINSTKFETVDKILGQIINNSYLFLKANQKQVANQVILVNNDRYKTFINWFVARYKNRVICKNLLELIQLFNANATSYKKLETPGMTYVVGSYNTEVNAPKAIKNIEPQQQINNLQPQVSSGFTSYWLLAIITIIVSIAVAIFAFMA